MFKRTFKVVFRPIKNNFILLPENYYNVVSTYDTGCLSLQYAAHVHYVSWAPYVSCINSNEIGINARSAKEIGLQENDVVKCMLIEDVTALQKVFVTPTSFKDWEIIELSSKTLASNVLDQIRVVNTSQMLVVWINHSLVVTLTVDRLKPNMSYGRINHTTQFIITPNLFNGLEIGTALNENQNITLDKSSNVLMPSYKTNRSSTLGVMKKCSNEKGSTSSFIPLSKVENQQKTFWEEYQKRLKRDLEHDSTNKIEFRVISGSLMQNDQLSDVYVSNLKWTKFTKPTTIYCLRTIAGREFFVKVHMICSNNITEISQHKTPLHKTIKISSNLMRILELHEFEKVVLQPKSSVLNFVEKVELFPHKKTHYRIVENAFKRYVIARTQCSFMILNQDEVIRLEDDLIVTVTLCPQHFQYCVIDSNFLKEGKIYAADVIRNVEDLLHVENTSKQKYPYLNIKPEDIIKVQCFDVLVEELVTNLKTSLCLDTVTSVLRQGNVILSGPSGSGKSVIIHRTLDELSKHPFNCFHDSFDCTRSKGRKVESIQRDLRQVFVNCLERSPSIVVLKNLDVIIHEVNSEHTNQDAEYHNRIADTVYQLITQYSLNNSLAVIVTINNLKTINKRVYSSRGRHIFHSVVQIPRLKFQDREKILRELCFHINSTAIDFKKYAKLTGGYNKSDLIDFIKRGIFYAYRMNKITPKLTNAELNESLTYTNPNCLQGIEIFKNNLTVTKLDDLKIEEIPGVEPVISVLEEVLKWPTEYSSIYKNSPLRNQAGVLIFGPPGTGKTFLVSRLAISWNLRVIFVKGPELLAKYIGQSEENVRNVFNRARSIKPCVLFFDEFDSLAPKRGHDSTGVTDRVVNQLLTEIDGVESLQGVTIIAATSRPELLDPALIRSGRIGRLVECSLPDTLARQRIFELLSTNLCIDESVDFKYFATKTLNFTGADIQSLLTSANMLAIKEEISSHGHEIKSNIFLREKHLNDALRATRPSLSTADIVKYKRIYARFTNVEYENRKFISKRTTLA